MFQKRTQKMNWACILKSRIFWIYLALFSGVLKQKLDFAVNFYPPLFRLLPRFPRPAEKRLGFRDRNYLVDEIQFMLMSGRDSWLKLCSFHSSPFSWERSPPLLRTCRIVQWLKACPIWVVPELNQTSRLFSWKRRDLPSILDSIPRYRLKKRRKPLIWIRNLKTTHHHHHHTTTITPPPQPPPQPPPPSPNPGNDACQENKAKRFCCGRQIAVVPPDSCCTAR